LVALFLALAISVLGEELVTAMADPSFHEAYKVIPLVALSYVLYGCYYQLAAGIYLEGKTKHMAVLMGVAAVLNVALNFALIPHYGIMGSAVATLIAYALLPVGAYVISQRYYHIDYEWFRVTKMVLAVTLVYVASVFVGLSYATLHSHMSATFAHIIVGVLKLLLLLAYPVLLYAFRFFRPEEIGLVRQFVRSALAYVGRRLGRKPSSINGPGNVGG
jgi:O-antigen/teichoic acid export membrane protein